MRSPATVPAGDPRGLPHACALETQLGTARATPRSRHGCTPPDLPMVLGTPPPGRSIVATTKRLSPTHSF